MVSVILISSFIVYIWDFLEAPQQMANSIVSHITKGRIKNVELKKPFGCATCMTFWLCLLYCLCTIECWNVNNVLFAIGLSLFGSFITKYELYFFNIIDLVISNIFVLLEKIINKINDIL